MTEHELLSGITVNLKIFKSRSSGAGGKRIRC